MFSMRHGTILAETRIPYRKWAIAIYLYSTNLKGISSMKTYRELGISQKSAWLMLQRLRKATETEGGAFSGPVEVDETLYRRETRKHVQRNPQGVEGHGPGWHR